MGEEKGAILQFAPFQSHVDEGFWHRLSSLKLNKLGIDDSQIPITDVPFFLVNIAPNSSVSIQHLQDWESCHNMCNEVTITAALGFDSYLVMRHGAGPLKTMSELSNETSHISPSNSKGSRLRCYFCNDVVAPIDVKI